jgi:hypothetical protein
MMAIQINHYYIHGSENGDTEKEWCNLKTILKQQQKGV